MGRRATVVPPCHRRGVAGDMPHVCQRRRYADGFCQLNGYSDPTERTPCVFDESPDAEIWRKVVYWRQQRKEVEPCEDC